MQRLWTSPYAIRCPGCGAQSNLLGADNRRGRTFQYCQCNTCALSFDRVIAPNGHGATVLYAVPSSQRLRQTPRVAASSAQANVARGAQEDAHAS